MKSKQKAATITTIFTPRTIKRNIKWQSCLMNLNQRVWQTLFTNDLRLYQDQIKKEGEHKRMDKKNYLFCKPFSQDIQFIMKQSEYCGSAIRMLFFVGYKRYHVVLVKVITWRYNIFLYGNFSHLLYLVYIHQIINHSHKEMINYLLHDE